MPMRYALLVVIGLGSIAACSAKSSPGKYADVRGIRMYYEVRGRGPVLVLLHGGTGNGAQFSKQIPAFEPHFRLIVPDLCAQGRTSDRPEPLTYHAMAEDVVALLDRLHVDRADVMGWSDGGVVALDIAVHHPDRLRHLVTFGANFAPDGLNPADVAWNDTATAASFGEGTKKAYAELAPDPSHYVEAMTKTLVMWRTEPKFTLAELASIRTKAMICAGEHDVVRPDHTAQLAATIPGARMWIVPRASHGAMLEQPDLVNRTVLEFLQN
jgi:pimeloyl-ACP methyl ester carboxylesterase